MEKSWDTTERREWLYTQSDDAVVAEICGLEASLDGALSDCHELIQENAALRSLVREMVSNMEPFYQLELIQSNPLVKEIMEAPK